MATIDIPAQDLPLWMRRARRGVDWGVLIAIAVSILAALPVLLQPGLPRTNASENYAFRTADYAQAISEGTLYPRWSPNVFGGYGAPIPSFFPPGAAYVPALIQFFFTADPVLAVRVVYIVSIIIAGSATYAFVLRRAGAASAVLASALYVFSPYASLVAPHVLGDLPAVMCLALLPSLLWSLDRLLFDGRAVDFLLTTICGAGLLLTHPQLALVGALIAAAYLTWYIVTLDRSARWDRVILAGLLSIGLASFFWLPAVAEQSAITWRSTEETPSLLLSLSSLLTPLRPIDPNELVHTPQLTLGQGLVIFNFAGVIICAYRRAFASFQLLFLLIGVSLILAGVTLSPRETWLLGPMVLCLSVAGTSPLLRREEAPRLYFPVLFAAALGFSITAWFAPRWSESFGSTDALAQVQHEQLGYGVAVIPAGTPVPSTLPSSLLPDQTLVNSYTSDTVRKIPASTGIQIGFLSHTTHGDQFQLEMQSSGSVRILTAYFPGWTAQINNMPAQLQRDSETGLINVTIPAEGSAELTVQLGMTSARAAAWLLSLSALVLTAVFAFRRFGIDSETMVEPSFLTSPEARLTALVVIIVGGLILLFTTPASPLSLTARPGYGLDESLALRSRTEVGLEAISYRLEGQRYQAGDTIPLTLYWRALRFLPANYRAQVFLLNLSTGQRWSSTGLRHPGGYPTQRWLTDRYVTDQYSIPLPEDIPAGEYVIAIEVFNCAGNCTEQNRLTFFDQDGKTLGQTLVLPALLTLQT